MNTVTCKATKQNLAFDKGDIFYDGDDGDFYILAEVSALKYCAVSLRDGTRWSNPKSTIEGAVQGLAFAGRDFKISLGE